MNPTTSKLTMLLGTASLMTIANAMETAEAERTLQSQATAHQLVKVSTGSVEIRQRYGEPVPETGRRIGRLVAGKVDGLADQVIGRRIVGQLHVGARGAIAGLGIRAELIAIVHRLMDIVVGHVHEGVA